MDYYHKYYVGITTVGSNSSKLLISPLIAWLIFALMMGMQEQQFKLTP
jgi:hypothetical protein